MKHITHCLLLVIFVLFSAFSLSASEYTEYPGTAEQREALRQLERLEQAPEKPEAPRLAEPPRADLTFHQVGDGQYGIANFGMLAWSTGNSALWSTWRMLYAHRTPREVFDIDLDENTAIIIASGTRPTGGYGVEVTSVYLQDGTLFVEYREIVPGPGTMVTQAITYPYIMGAVEGQHTTVEFIKLPPRER